jgi:hypothetical protein
MFAPRFVEFSLFHLQFQMMTGNFVVLKSLGIGLLQLPDIVWYVVSVTTVNFVIINGGVEFLSRHTSRPLTSSKVSVLAKAFIALLQGHTAA